MEDLPRVAVVGYGLGGSVFHAPLIESSPRLALTAVVTSNPERQEEVRRRYPNAGVVRDIDQLLGRAQDWDLAVITTPNASHLALAEEALKAGLSVVVDKPVTTAAAGAEGLARLAAGRGASVIPFHNRRWDGDYRTVADLVSGARLGRIRRFESRFERWRPQPPVPGSWKADPAQPGSGILFDLGTHLVDQAIHLFGSPAQVYCEQAAHVSAVDDDTFVALVYPGGPAVHLWASSSAAQLGPRFRVLGSERAYVKYGMDPQEAALRAGRTPAEAGWGEEQPGDWGHLGTVGATEPVPTRPGAYQDFYAGVAAHLTRGEPPPVSIDDAVSGLRVLEAARRSATTGTVVSIEP